MGELTNITIAIANKDRTVKHSSDVLSQITARLRASLGIPPNKPIEEAAREADQGLQIVFRDYFMQKRRLDKQIRELGSLIKRRESMRKGQSRRRMGKRRRLK